MPKGFQKPPFKNPTTRERANVFAQRRSRPLGFDWHNVDSLELMTALSVCSTASVTLSFAPAQGGVGVTIRFYAGNLQDDAYASCAEQLNELLALLIEEYRSESEDPRLALKGLKVVRAAGD